MRVERISAQAFRGYPERVDLATSGDVVLVVGENGSGKTSLTEAFEWALYGTVVRKRRSKTPGEYRGLDWVRSVHAEKGVPTLAEVELSTRTGTRHVVRRWIDGGVVKLTIDGRAATDITSLNLKVEDAFRPFLGQCEIQAVIDSEQQDRWEQLSAILGFGSIGETRARLQRLRTNADHDPRVRSVRETALRAVQPLTALGDDPLAIDPEDLRRRASGFLHLSDGAPWEEIELAATQELEDLYTRDRRPAALASLVGTVVRSVDVPALSDQLDIVVHEAVTHRAWHRANRKAQFASDGLALLDSTELTHCPFCDQETLSERRIAVLAQLASERPSPPQDSRARVSASISDVLAQQTINHDVANSFVDRLDADDRDRVGTLLKEAADCERLKEGLRGLAEGFLSAVSRARDFDGEDGPLESLASQVATTAEKVVSASQSIRAAAEALVIDVTAKMAGLTIEEKARLAALQKAKLLAENRSAIAAAWRARDLQARMAELVARLEAAEKARMQLALRTLSADIAAYYEELSPGRHITIKGVSVRESRYRQASLEAESYGKAVNPVTTFSEAQANCLGISVYFSQRVDRNPEWQTILLDDPVQSMDAGHEQGLVGLLARVSRTHQIVVMTHDYRFAEAVAAQFEAVSSFTRYNIGDSGSPQPGIEVAAGRLDELLGFAEGNASGGRAMRESCASAIRKAVERFTSDLATRHKVTLAKRLTIEDRVRRIHEAQLIDDIEVGTLHRLRRFGSRASHDDPVANISDSAIRSSARSMRELQSKYLLDRSPSLRLVTSSEDERRQPA